MKLKTKILISAIIPVLLLGIVISVVTSGQIKTAMYKQVEVGMQATATAVRGTFEYGAKGNFHLSNNGDFWKGNTLNISTSFDIVDNIKNTSGMEVTIFYGDTRYLTSIVDKDGNRITGTKASEKVVDEVLNKGNNFSATNIDIQGKKYVVYYTPIRSKTDAVIGMIFVGKEQSLVENQVKTIEYYIYGVTAIVMLLCSVIVFIITGRISKALKKGVVIVDEFSKGNLNVKVENKLLKRKDEIGIMCRSIESLREEMTGIISNIKLSSSQLNEASVQMSRSAVKTEDSVAHVEKAIQEIAMGANSQAEETQKATENVIIMGNMVEETKDEADRLNVNAVSMKKSSDEASKILSELEEINKSARESIKVIYEQTNTTNVSAQKIKEATVLITSIADETNLLSLNASIEAARAGEAGRGFAVVAAQIQKLAEQSNESARQIDQIIASLINDSNKAVETMNEVTEIMERQSKHVAVTDEKFEEVKHGIEESIEGVKVITEKTKEINEARVNVVDIVQNLTAIAQENAASTEETSASTTEVGNTVAEIAEDSKKLLTIAEELEASVQIFKM